MENSQSSYQYGIKMTKKIGPVFLTVLLCSIYGCKSTHMRKPLAIVLEVGMSYKYNLQQGIYTIYFFTREPMTIEFTLDSAELEAIQEKYYLLKIDNVLMKYFEYLKFKTSY